AELENKAAKYELETAPERMQMKRDEAKIEKADLELRTKKQKLAREKFEADVGLDSEGAVVYIGNCPGCGKDLSSVKGFDEHKER
ncbi:hypothetical protein LCGC14_3119720, partial [marine sediment metagenome]